MDIVFPVIMPLKQHLTVKSKRNIANTTTSPVKEEKKVKKKGGKTHEEPEVFRESALISANQSMNQFLEEYSTIAHPFLAEYHNQGPIIDENYGHLHDGKTA